MRTRLGRFCSIAVFAVALFAALDAGADVVVLKNGSKLDGTIIKQSATEVVVEVAYGRLTFKPDEIKEIVKKDGTVETFKPQVEPGLPEPADHDPQVAQPPNDRTPVEQKPSPSLDQVLKDFGSIAQTPRVTLNAFGRPVVEVIAEIASQTKREIRCSLAKDDAGEAVTLLLQDVPMWEAVLAVCKECETGFKLYSQPGNPIAIGAGKAVVREYKVFGPFALVWFGMCGIDALDSVKDPSEAATQNWMVLSLHLDPGAETKVEDWGGDLVFKFNVDGGNAVEVKPSDAFQDGMGGRSWWFSPDSALIGKAATLEAVIPVSAATRSSQTAIPWKSGGEARSGKLSLTLGEIKQTDKRLSASLKIAYDKSAVEAMRTEEQIRDSLISVKELALIGSDGSRTTPEISSGGASGLGEYNYEITFLLQEGSQPVQLQVTWHDGYKFFKLPFRIEDIPLVK